MAKTTDLSKVKVFKKTVALDNTFVKRYSANDNCFPRLSFSEEYFLVTQKDLVKNCKLEDCGLKPKFCGDSKDMGKYVIIGVNDFGKLIDKEKIRKDLVKVAQQSLREDPSVDDYFKMLYSNTLRHIAYILTDAAFKTVRLSQEVKYFLSKNMNFLPFEAKQMIVSMEGGFDI